MSESAEGSLRISAEDLEAFVLRALTGVGMSEEDAQVTADVLVTTDTFGVFTHGTKNLGGYVWRLRGGGLVANARPAVVKEGPGWAVVDGNCAVGMVTGIFGMRKAIEKAREAGTAYVGVRNTCHAGAMGYYALMAANAGMFGQAMANDIPGVAPPGSRGPGFGTNPFAYALPAGEHRPVFLDIATSVAAGGKIHRARDAGETLPDRWIVDERGLPSDDPQGYPETKTLRPMGNHKGYGIAFMIEALAGALAGAGIMDEITSWMRDDPTAPTNHGGAFLAINVGAAASMEAFTRRIDEIIEYLHGLPLAEGADRIYVPGEMEWERRDKALAEGIELPSDVVESLRRLADDLPLDASILR